MCPTRLPARLPVCLPAAVLFYDLFDLASFKLRLVEEEEEQQPEEDPEAAAVEAVQQLEAELGPQEAFFR